MDLNQVLSPGYLSSLKGLALKARMVLEGTMAGRHLSPFHGFSSEFAQYKGYVPGDDLKFLDWKVYGRNDQLVTRQYRDETNAGVYLVVDRSESMGYQGNGPVTKLEYAVAADPETLRLNVDWPARRVDLGNFSVAGVEAGECRAASIANGPPADETTPRIPALSRLACRLRA